MSFVRCKCQYHKWFLSYFSIKILKEQLEQVQDKELEGFYCQKHSRSLYVGSFGFPTLMGCSINSAFVFTVLYFTFLTKTC